MIAANDSDATVEFDPQTNNPHFSYVEEDKTRHDVPRMSEHQREQPDDPRDAGLILETHHETGEVDLRLMPGWCLEADLKRLWPIAWTDGSDTALHGRVGAP